MIRVRDLELITRDVVRSTSREDAMEAIKRNFGAVAKLNEDGQSIATFQNSLPKSVVRLNPAIQGAKSGAYISLTQTINSMKRSFCKQRLLCIIVTTSLSSRLLKSQISKL